jgi:hypothetical protein
MVAPTQVTIYYSTSSTQVLSIPDGVDYSNMILNIVRGGGFWFRDSTELLTWIPMNQVTKVTAA